MVVHTITVIDGRNPSPLGAVQFGRPAPAPASADHGMLRRIAALGAALIVARLIASIFVPLIPQEAYYWMYSQHLQLSYFDHPPMIAWMIRLGTSIFGDTEIGVRLMGQCLMLAASALLYGWSRLWYNRRVSLIAALSLQFMPIFFVLGLLATMDSSLIFFWAAALLGFGWAVRRNKPAAWYLAGLAIGGAMLAKYTAAFLPLGFLICLLCYRPWRGHLKTLHPWLAMLIAAAMFSPVILWNMRHDWASFRFQLIGRLSHDNNPHPGLHYFLGEQLVVLTPFVFLILPLLIRRACRRGRLLRSPRSLVALAFSLPMFGVMATSAIRHDVHINWTPPLYLSLIPFIVQALAVRLRARPRQTSEGIWLGGTKATVFLSSAVNLAGTALILCTPLWSPYVYSPFGPWKGMASEVEHIEDDLEKRSGQEPLVIGEGKFELASELAFYRPVDPVDDADDRPSQSTTTEWIVNGREGVGYRYWMERDNWVGRDCVVVGPAQFLKARVEPWFDSVEIRDLSVNNTRHPMAVAICHKLHRHCHAHAATQQ